jgi:hypothetical protein
MLVAVCVSLGLFGTVPVKAEDDTDDVISEIEENITEDKLYIYCWSNTDLATIVNLFKEYYPQYADLVEFRHPTEQYDMDRYEEYMDDIIASGSEPASLIAMDDGTAELMTRDYVQCH